MSAAIGTSTPSFTQPSGVVKQTACTAAGIFTDVFLNTNTPEACSQPVTEEKKPVKEDKLNKVACTVAGKEDLQASDPACKEEMCTVVGKEDLAANDPNCKEDAVDDADGDGVPDSIDQCPNTPSGSAVDAVGCAVGQTPGGPSGQNKPIKPPERNR